jgi:hypothetical protein
MATNEDLVRKAVITADTISSNGKLNDAQADKFIDFVIDITGLDKMARVVRFRNENLNIDKLGVGARVTMPANEGRDPGYRKGVSATQVVLSPAEIMTPFEISDTFREVNLEGDSVEDHIVKMMATQMGNDVEDLYINGDTTGPAVLENVVVPGGSSTQYVKDTYLALMNGWMTLAESGNTVDLGGANISANTFSQMLNAMPIKFRRQKDRLRFLCSPDLEQLYRERVASRATMSGDAALASMNALTPFGVPLIPVPLMDFYVPRVEHITFTGSGTSASLSYGPIQGSSVVVTSSTLGTSPESAYTLTTDYTVDATTGTITHAGGGSAIGATATVKVTYNAYPQMILTHMDNLIVGIGRDIRIEKDRDIFKRVNQYAITSKVAVAFEEDDAVVHGYNIGNAI